MIISGTLEIKLKYFTPTETYYYSYARGTRRPTKL